MNLPVYPLSPRNPRLLVGRATSGYNFSVPQALSNLHLKVLFFGRLRELTGISEESLEIPAGTTLADIFDRYAARFPKLASFRSSLVASCNEEFASWDTPVLDDDTISFLPPVSGG
jgi:molybdopterin converting factor subunit 1